MTLLSQSRLLPCRRAPCPLRRTRGTETCQYLRTGLGRCRKRLWRCHLADKASGEQSSLGSESRAGLCLKQCAYASSVAPEPSCAVAPHCESDSVSGLWSGVARTGFDCVVEAGMRVLALALSCYAMLHRAARWTRSGLFHLLLLLANESGTKLRHMAWGRCTRSTLGWISPKGVGQARRFHQWKCTNDLDLDDCEAAHRRTSDGYCKLARSHARTTRKRGRGVG